MFRFWPRRFANGPNKHLKAALIAPIAFLWLAPCAEADQRHYPVLQIAYNAGEMCELKATRDGFVALRKGPSVKHKRIKKLISGIHRISVAGPIRQWVKVDVAIPEGRGAGDWSGTGYVFSKLVDWQNCGLAG